MNINVDIDNFHMGFFLSAWWVWEAPKREKWRSG